MPPFGQSPRVPGGMSMPMQDHPNCERQPAVTGAMTELTGSVQQASESLTRLLSRLQPIMRGQATNGPSQVSGGQEPPFCCFLAGQLAKIIEEVNNLSHVCASALDQLEI